VKLLQNRIPLGKLSISVRMEAPVVVNPETVSKNALITFGIAPLRTKGIVPNTDMRSQALATHTKPSLAKILVFFGLKITQGSEMRTSIPAVIRKG
jgi:hypothetical protein